MKFKPLYDWSDPAMNAPPVWTSGKYKRYQPPPKPRREAHIAYIGNVWANEERRASRVAAQAARSLTGRPATYYRR